MKMTKSSTFLLLFSVLLFQSFLRSEKTVPMPDLMKPGSIIIDGDELLITDGPHVLIYSLKDLSLKNKFGTMGEGPGEFKLHRNVNRGSVEIAVHADYILVNSISKASFFKRDGQYIKEVNTRRTSGNFFPIRDQYVGERTFQDKNGVEYVSINIYDSEFKKLKEVYRKVSWDEAKKLNPVTFTQWPMTYICDEKIFVDGDKEKGFIHVFNREGKELHVIKYDYKRQAFTSKDKKKYEHFFNNSSKYKGFLQGYKKIIQFPKHYPIIRNYHVADKKVYVITFMEKDSKRECFIFDVDGNFKKRVMLKLAEMSPIHLYPYTTNNDKLYQLVEGQASDGDIWELHITAIK